MKIHTGTSGWHYEQWAGPFYPKNMKPDRYLEYYSRLFDAVEIDSTFYNIPEERTILKWKQQTPENFKFCPKMFRRITHDLRLNSAEGEIESFLERIRHLGNKLGPILIQMPPSLKFIDLGLLRHFAEGLPDDLDFAIEFRDESWFNDEVFSLLERNNIVLAWSDVPFVKRHFVITSNILYLRLVGDRSLNESQFGKIIIQRDSELEEWSFRLRQLMGEYDHVFAFANNHFQGFAPGTINLLRPKLGLQEIDFCSPGYGNRQSRLF